MKEKINPFEYSSEILAALGKGILLTTRGEEKINTMTIGWGSLGIDWGLPVFIAYVRPTRFTYGNLIKHPEFTINVPAGPYDRKILGVAGTKSGRDLDKISALGLHLEEPEIVSVPGIRELPLTLECKVIYSQAQDPASVPLKIRDTYYPAEVSDINAGANNSYHTAFYGEIVAAYIIK